MPPTPTRLPTRARDIRAVMPHDDEDERLLSKAEVIDRTGKSFVTIWTWMRAGKFPRDCDAHGRPA
jgi:predicted DNA-binding transcriptional regulator AlpA